MAYADLEDFKAYLRLSSVDETDDEELQRVLDTASSQIAQFCSQKFDPASDTAAARLYSPYWHRRAGRWVVPVDAFQTTDDLALRSWDGTGYNTVIAVEDVGLYPLNASPDAPWTLLSLPAGVHIAAGGDGERLVQITARWGWTTTPAPVVQATLLQASRLYMRRTSAFGVVSDPAGTMGTTLRNAMDVDAQQALAGYIKYWGAR